MLTIFSNEIDVEMSDKSSDNSTEYRFRNFNEDDYENDGIFSSVNEESATKNSDNLLVNSQSYSYYDRKNIISANIECNTKFQENDHFDANDLRGIFKNIDFTGDKVDSGNSIKRDIVSQYAFEQALKLNQLRREIVSKSKSSNKYDRFVNRNVTTSSNSVTNSRKHENTLPPKKCSLFHAVGKDHNSNYKTSATKENSDRDSITLLIKVPRNKLISHIKNKSVIETWKTSSSKSSSCDSLSSRSSDEDSETLQEDKQYSEILSEQSKLDSFSESIITSIVDNSNEIIENHKTSLNKSNKKLQTLIPDIIQSAHQSDKVTQTLSTSPQTMTNTANSITNYFLCNICHKIVPATLSPVCLKLSCSAIKQCNLIFHGELDMIMHLPVKHTNEFASYHICSKCNRMYPPSNIVTMKGLYMCLDCIASLAQLTIDN